MKAATRTTLIMVALFTAGVLVGGLLLSRRSEPREEPRNLQVELVQDPVDTVRNPYAPPVRQHCEDAYNQLGYLSSGNEKLPLFGKRACHRDKWFYYTEVDGIKLPVEFKKRNCTASTGCDMLACRDSVVVDGRSYTATLYESALFQYNPFSY